MEWCGIVARTQDTSSTVSCDRTNHSDTAKSSAAKTMIPALAVVFSYMRHMKASMITVIAAPIRTAM